MADWKFYTRNIIRIEDRKRIPVPQGIGFSYAPDGYTEVEYAVDINHEELRQMAFKAAKNKGGKSKDGAVQVRIIKRTKLTA